MKPSLTDFRMLGRQYRTALLDDVLPFWERHSLDTRDGGFFSCLSRDGSVYDTDKFIWPQCRQVWLYSMLFNKLERRERWLEIAAHGVRFLRAHGMDPEGNWYFALAMGYRLTRHEECLEWLRRVHEYTWAHFPDPEYGEWFGYLDRRGGVLTPLKGGKWKGCFHIPRGLFLCADHFDRIAEESGRLTQRTHNTRRRNV